MVSAVISSARTQAKNILKTYGVHIPIITNPGCKMVIEDVAEHMPADGSVTITNNTKYHNFFNGGEQDRVHLVACVLENPFKKSN